LSRDKKLTPIVLQLGAGREYAMGPVHAIFKADGVETRGQYAISEWWLDPYTRGPGPHKHPEDDIFFVIEGTMSFFVGGAWTDAPKGSLVIAPGGTEHDFENRTAKRAGALNLSVPGNFEPEMSGIAEWFRARSADASRTANAPRRRTGRPDRRPARKRARK
jgi:mannose-6-phosphate isomerase-like protein (cupin superfamily)